MINAAKIAEELLDELMVSVQDGVREVNGQTLSFYFTRAAEKGYEAGIRDAAVRWGHDIEEIRTLLGLHV